MMYTNEIGSLYYSVAAAGREWFDHCTLVVRPQDPRKSHVAYGSALSIADAVCCCCGVRWSTAVLLLCDSCCCAVYPAAVLVETSDLHVILLYGHCGMLLLLRCVLKYYRSAGVPVVLYTHSGTAHLETTSTTALLHVRGTAYQVPGTALHVVPLLWLCMCVFSSY